MAITDEKKNLLLGQDSEELIKNADDNFTSLFDTVDDLDDAIKNSGFITKDVNNLTNYTVKGETGTDVELSIDNKTYVMTLNLKNSVGAVVSTATIDFPIESVVVDGSYADGTLTLTLQNGTKIDVDISAIVSGLVPNTRKVNGKALSSDITLTQDGVGDGTTYKRYSATEKSKLAGIEEGANKYTHPSYTAKISGLYKITVDATGHVSAVTAVTKADITGLGIPAQDTTYNDATESASGLMSASDKAKLNAIDESLKGVTADEIGKVKDVQVNGSTVLDKSTGIANIVIDVKNLQGNYVEVTPTAVTLNSKSYKAIVVAETDVTLEVLNSEGKAVVTQVIRANGNIYYCLPSTDTNTYTLRKVGGNAVGGGSSKLYRHRIYMSMTGGAHMTVIYYNRSSEPFDTIYATWTAYPVVGMYGNPLSPILFVDFNFGNYHDRVKIYTVANPSGAEVYYQNISVVDTVEEVV